MIKKSEGFSLVEVLLVLGFAAILIAGAFLGYSKVKESSNVNHESNNLATITAGIKALYQGKPNYADLETDIAIAANIIPESGIDGNLVYNKLGGDQGRIIVRAHAGNANFFDIIYTKVPTKVCVKFVTQAGQSSEGISIDSRYVGGTDAVKQLGKKLDINKLVEACNASKTHSIYFVSS